MTAMTQSPEDRRAADARLQPFAGRAGFLVAVTPLGAMPQAAHIVIDAVNQQMP
jgi:hypothetical protein